MTSYTLTYNTSKGELKTLSVDATSASHAIVVGMELLEELKLHPNRITQIFKEDTK
jgi:hypothetical protein